MHARNVQPFGKLRYRVHIRLQIRKHLRAFKRQHYVRKAGVLYSWSLRQLLLVVPAVAFMLHPLGGLISAAPIVIVLVHFDRFHPTADGMPKLSL